MPLTGCEAYRSIISQYDWDVNTAMAVMQAESGCIADRNNAGLNWDGSVDRGLFQVNSIHADMVGGNLDSLYDPATNVRIAYSLSHNGASWQAWMAYTSGAYLKFL